MVLIAVECGACGNYPIWEVGKPSNLEGKWLCLAYPRGIPNYVEDGSKPCPNFVEKKDA